MKHRYKMVTAVLLCAACLPGLAETALHISTGFTPPVSDFFRHVLREADKRLDNISISFEILSAERSVDLVNKGINDGECCRIPDVIYKDYKNLSHVPESFFSARFSAFTKNNNIIINDFSDLKPYSVGTVIGWKIAVNKVHQVQPAKELVVSAPEQLFTMLDQEHIDVGVHGYLSGLQTISQLNIVDIKAITPPLIEKELYLMLSNKHRGLVPEFTRVFKDMKDDGTIDHLYNQVFELILIK